MGLLSRRTVIAVVEKSISNRQVLSVTYQHALDGEIVVHRIAPFDIGSTNPKTKDRFRNTIFAYSFTHVDDKTGRPDPKVCAFSIDQFHLAEPTGDTFNETELAIKNLRVTKYDYRNCNFAILPERDWFEK